MTAARIRRILWWAGVLAIAASPAVPAMLIAAGWPQ